MYVCKHHEDPPSSGETRSHCTQKCLKTRSHSCSPRAPHPSPATPKPTVPSQRQLRVYHLTNDCARVGSKSKSAFCCVVSAVCNVQTNRIHIFSFSVVRSLANSFDSAARYPTSPCNVMCCARGKSRLARIHVSRTYVGRARSSFAPSSVGPAVVANERCVDFRVVSSR